MLHQPSGAIGGKASDIEVSANLLKQLRTELYDVLSHHSGKDAAQIALDCTRDNWMTALQAKEYGLVDEVLMTNPSK
jgi:ATP-dependent Clp protease protease subunit